MLIRNYNTTFKRIEKTDLETLRYWRNSHDINQFMEYREYITPEMQLNWFNKINNISNFYFLIECNGANVGLINCKDINNNEKKFEVGIFIFENVNRNNIIFPISSLVICETIADFFKIETIETHILTTNISFSKMLITLGYKLCESQERILNQKYFIEKPDMLKTFQYLRTHLVKVHGEQKKTKIIFNNSDLVEIKDFFLNSYHRMPNSLKQKYSIN